MMCGPTVPKNVTGGDSRVRYRKTNHQRLMMNGRRSTGVRTRGHKSARGSQTGNSFSYRYMPHAIADATVAKQPQD
jgi:hypothetical protein